jgi:hypothetical protein
MRTVTNRVETLLHMGSESLGPFRSAAGATEKDGYVRLKKNWSCSRRNTSRNQSRHTWPGQARTMVNVETIARRAVPFGTRNHFSKHRFSGQLALRRICFVEHHQNWGNIHILGQTSQKLMHVVWNQTDSAVPPANWLLQPHFGCASQATLLAP